MTVAHFTTYAFSPTETFVYHLIRAQQIPRPVVVTQARRNPSMFPLSADVLELYGTWQWRKVIRSVNRRMLGRRTSRSYDDARVRRFIRRNDVSILHAHFGTTGWLVLPVRRSTNVPIVTTFYGADMSRKPRDPVWRKRYASLFDEGDLFLVEGPHMAQSMVALGCPAGRLLVQRIGIPLDALTFVRRSPPADRATRIVFCGRFVEKKGLAAAVNAVADATRAGYRIEFRIIGDGPLRSEIEQRVRTRGLESSVRFLGMLPYDAVMHELVHADILIQPSVTAADGDSEGGAPTILLEAQAMGLPILSTTHADIPFVVADGAAGLLAPEGDTAALGERLVELLAQSDRWGDMGLAGRHYVETNHDVRITVAQLEQAYLKVRNPN